MINKSFQLLRTNPALTTNIKMVVDEKYNLYLESFNTNKQLSDTKYKHYLLNKNNLYEDQIIKFYDGLNSNLAFDIKYDNDITNVFSSYDKQFDDIYWSGAKSIEDTWYNENFEYFAPLYIRKHNIPDGFVILRIDDSMPYDELSNEYGPSKLNKNNFYNQIVDKWKCVNFFDMRNNNDFGYFINNNFKNNNRYPDNAFELDIRQFEYSKFYGIDYLNGVYVTKSNFLQDILYYEQPHFKLEKEILNTFKNNNLIYPHILNLKFLFKDIPATPDKINNYSLNRYYGFYIDKLDFVTNLTSYITPEIKSGYKLKNNIFVDENDIPLTESPFIEKYTINKNYWIQYKNDFYKVIRNLVDGNYVYQIISDFDMSGLTFENINNRTCFINYKDSMSFNCVSFNNPSGYTNYISGLTSDFKIDEHFGELQGDLYLIKIDDKYHVLKYKNGNYYIQSDYAINSNHNILEYWKGGKNGNFYVNKNIYSNTYKPLQYPIYRLRFSDIKDFDFNRVNTHFSDFDYQKDTYNITNEHKLYSVDYNNTSVLNKNFMYHPKNEDGQYNIMNVSSEYIATDELYEISFDNLTDIWRKNQSVVKWGAKGSNCKCDYPYKFNNSIDVGNVYNGNCNIKESEASELEKNLDYFYRIGNFYKGTLDNKVYYLNQTTNIEIDFMDDFSKKFNLDLYLKSDVDYFDYFFKNKSYFELNNEKYVKATNKYSTFHGGDLYTKSTSIFKGLNIEVISVDDITRDINGKILNIISNNTKNYNNYKLSIILNDVYNYYNDDNVFVNTNENGLCDNNIIDKSKNGIHVFLNDKFENILIIININIPMLEKYKDFNNIDIFGEKNGLYTAKTLNGEDINIYDNSCYNTNNVGDNDCILEGYIENIIKEYKPTTITASNFINSINNMNNISSFDVGVNYYYIDKYKQSGTTGQINIIDPKNNMINIESWKKNNPPFLLNIKEPELLYTKKQSYEKGAIKGPMTNIYDKYQTYYDNIKKQKYNIIEPLSRYMKLNVEENNLNTIYSSNQVYTPNSIYRYNTIYEPIFLNIPLFKNTIIYKSGNTYKQIDSNYKFDVEYENFGIVEELIFSKINPYNSPLKLKNTDKDKSIYPMVDEFGYQFGSKFIFDSTWDKDFFIITNSEQNINKHIFSNLSSFEYIIDPLKPKK